VTAAAVRSVKKPVNLAVVTSMLIAVGCSSASAQQPPRQGCVAVSKEEFRRSKKRTPYVVMSSGKYVRSGRLWRRYYWYCPYRV